ncbi:MAG: NAD(P)H-hydrate dehydratase [Candidatus Dormibacteraeota bacterium]|nr:NAD(P)H-hydrate dehydratase [Candidatus Dormibacteraeota bacterium]MBV9524690.1 NAD(P)H-hydrate dehydratase [Candidatus Dormibacteraeota bacterium]
MLVGVDVTSIARVGAVVERTPRFATRVYTEQERRVCAGKPQRWASRWAAKEAVRKLYSSGGMPMPAYRDIEVMRGRGGPPRVAVRGEVTPIALSLTHDAGVAIAVAVDAAPQAPRLLMPASLRLAERPEDGHKGTFGRVVVIAGARGYTGAPRLAAYGAARAGAGLVTVCVPESIYPIVAAACLEVMPAAVDDAGSGALHPAGLNALRERMRTADAVVIGPGLGRAPETERVVIDVLQNVPCPAVVDADALNIAAATGFDWRRTPQPVVVTPHPAEMARLAGIETAVVQQDRRGLAVAYARERGVTIVLKGSETVIASPRGDVHVDAHRVVALASGGTGDVLAGVIAAMLAQGLEAFEAAVAGVTVHAEAGAMVQEQRGRAGALASDVIEALPAAQERLRRALEWLSGRR